MRFPKLHKKIYLSLLLICLGLILVIDAIAVAVQVTTLDATYKTLGQARIERIRNSCSLYVSSVNITTYNLSQNGEVIDELTNSTGRSLTATLDESCNFALRINAITVYATDGRIYTSSRITDVPTLNELYQNSEIAAFLDGEADSFLSLRTDTIATIYENTLYPPQMGIVTSCHKIYNGKTVVGYIFSDILPSSLYSYFEDGLPENSISFITTEKDYFAHSGNDKYGNLLTEQSKDYFYYSAKAVDEGFTVVALESKSTYRAQIIVFTAVMIAVSALLTVGLHFLSRHLAKSVTSRLDSFLERMDNEVPKA